MPRIPSFLRLLLSVFALSALAACSDGGGDGPAMPAEDVDRILDGGMQPARAIVDGAGGGGNPHFHWLYPISSSPSYSGVFDPTLLGRVTVEVCALAGDACAGAPLRTFSATAASYWEQIRVSTRRQHYLVYWSSAGTDPSIHYRVRVLLDGSRELGYADVDVVPSRAGLAGVDPGEHVGLVAGSWLSIAFRLEEGLDDANTAPTVTITAPGEGAEVGPGPVGLQATATDAEDGDLSSAIAWSSDVDGALGSGAALEMPLSPGSHTLTASVIDGGGLAASGSVSITVRENRPPQVSISSPVDGESFLEGDGVVLAATASDPDGGVDLSPGIVWTAEPAIDGITPGPALTLQPPVGSYDLTATVSDELGAEGSASVSITVTEDAPPTVAISAPADGATVQEGATVTLAATATDAVDGDLTGELLWSSDVDGPVGSGGSVEVGLSVGTHLVTASATDSRGGTGSAAVSVTVAPNTAPTVSITEPAEGTSVVEGTALTFSGSATDAQEGDLSGPLTWVADTEGPLGTGATLDVALPVGTHVVTAVASDGLGATGSAAVTVTVTQDAPPTVAISAPADGATVQEGATVTLAATATDAVDGDLTGELLWSSDVDGPVGSGGSVEVGLSVGTHLLTASATDSRGGTGSAAVSVTVAPNTAPTVSITEPAEGAVFQSGDVPAFAGIASDEQDGDLTASIQWTSDQDGALGTGAAIEPDLSGGGHRVTAAVTDALGATTEVGIDVLVGIVGVQQTLSVPFSATASLPITLAEPAPPAGLSLTVTSADPSIVEIRTPTVEIAPGALAANALVEGIAPGEVTLTVSTPNLGSGTSEATVTGELGMEPATLVFTGGFGPGSLQVGLFSGGNPAVAPPGGLEVALAADDPACVAVPATASVPQGQGGVEVEASWGGGSLPCSTTVRVSAPNLDPASADVRLRAPPTFEFSPAIADRLADGVGSGLMIPAQGRLSVPDHGGTTLTLTSSDPSRLLVGRSPYQEGQAEVTVTVPDEETGFSFWVHGVEGNPGDVELELTASGVPSTVLQARVVQPYVTLTGIPGQRQVFGNDTEPSFQTGIVADGGWRVQGPRHGTVVRATLTSSDSALAAFDLGDEVFSDQAEVESMGYSSGFPTFGAATLQANDIGVVTIRAEAPGFLPYQAEREMEIIGSDIILTDGGNVGNGLMAPLSGRLSERPPEDTPVTIVANDPDRVLVSFAATSTDGSPVARDSIQTGPLNRNGFLRFPFRVHVLEDATEPGTVTVSAPGYNPTTVTIVPDPDIEYLLGLFGRTGGGSMSRTVETVERGLSYSATLRLQNGSPLGGQVVRSDHPNPPALELTSSDLGVGGFLFFETEELVDTARIAFAPGRSQTGIEFRPDQPGTTTVRVTNPTGELEPYGPTSGVVTVIGTPIQASDQIVGHNLMDLVYFYLSQYAVEDLTATITSSDPSVLRVGSPGFNTPGESHQDVVTRGNNRIEFSLHGMAPGTADLTVEAPGYETTTLQVTVVEPAIRIARGLPGSVRTFDDPDPFSFWVGHTAGSSFAQQRVRTGFGPLPVTVTSSDSDVGLLQAASAPDGSGISSITVDLPEGAYVIGEGNPAAPAFVPVVNGTTQLTLSAPGFGSTTRSVTVVSPQISVGARTRVGGGLHRADNTIVMGSPYGSPNHGGVTLTLESSDPSRLLLGPPDGTDPAGTYTVFMPDGETRIDFAVHGVQGTTATNVQIRATAQGFVDGTDFVDVVEPRFRVSGLGSSLAGPGSSDLFDLRMETASYEYGWVSDPDGLPVTLTSSDPTVVAAGAGEETGESVTVTIPRGDYWLLGTLYTLGVSPGTATVTLSAPGFEPYTRAITVNSP